MKVLIATNQFPSISTPFIDNIVTGLIDHGIQVIVFSLEEGDFQNIHQRICEYNNQFKLVTLRQVPHSFSKRIKFLFENLSEFKKRWSLLFRALNFFKHGRHALSLRYFYECYSSLDIGEPDLIHAQFGPVGVFFDRLKSDGIISRPLITHFRGYDTGKIFKFKRKSFYNHLFKNGSFFIANCSFFLKKIVEMGAPENRCAVVYSGIDEKVFNKTKDYSNKVKDQRFKLCTVSRLTDKKGIKYNILALAEVRRRRPDIQFTYSIIGDGECRGELIKLTNEVTLQKEVTFLGAKNHSFIQSFVITQDVFLSHNITSENGDQDAPVNVIKEAYLMKLPVISTLHGGIPELVVHDYSGYLVKEKDFIDMADKIILLYDNFCLRERFAENGYTFVNENFLNTKIINQLIGIYKDLLNRY